MNIVLAATEGAGMDTPELAVTRHDTSAWAPPLPDVPGVEHLVVRTPGLRTHVATLGEGPPVVLLHGFPQHWWQWRTVAPVIAAHGYRVIAPDLRGAGWTEADAPGVQRESRLHDLLALLDALGVDRAHLVSHDMGAITAMQLTYDHPERVRAAVQLSVPPAFMTFHPTTIGGFSHLPAFIWHRPGASLASVFGERYVARPMSPATLRTHLAPLSRPEVDAAVRRLTRGMILPEAMRLARGVYRRRRLAVPTLFVYGREDRYWNEEVIGKVCRHPERHADRTELAYVDGASHFVTDDNPDAVADLCLDWFARAA
jgi:pimeloyl-ACP methyl ester carboxylesterase